MAHRLDKLKITKVALVKRGANPQADVLLFKSADPVTKDDYATTDGERLPLTTNQLLQQNRLWAQWEPLWSAFTSSVWAIMGCGESAEAHLDVLMTSIDEFATSARDILSGLGLVAKAAPLFAVCEDFKHARVAKAGAVMSAARRNRLQEAIAALQAILSEAEPRPAETTTPAAKGDRMSTIEEVTKRADTAEARVKELEAENLTLKKQVVPEQTEEEFLKAMPEALRKRWEENERLTKEALDTAKVEKEKRERQEYIEKTATYRQVGITPDHWNVLKAIDALPEQERTELLRILASANEAIKQGNLFKTAGKDGSGHAGSAATRIETIAKEKATASGGKLTYEQAYDQVLTEQPDLYAQMRTEQRQ